mgnify:CR=1 FL=1
MLQVQVVADNSQAVENNNESVEGWVEPADNGWEEPASQADSESTVNTYSDRRGSYTTRYHNSGLPSDNLYLSDIYF